MENAADSSSHPFRDGTAGAEAKRLKLLRDRRDELATMSHEIRKIYVQRFSRLLSSIALALGGAVIVAASLDEDLANSIAGLLPGESPAALSTMLLGAWVVAGFALFSGRAWAERRFATAMSKAVLPTDELHMDVGRLGFEDPAMVGRAITRQLVPLSRMVSILAAGLILPLTGLAGYLVVCAGGYPLVDDVELLFAEQAHNLILIAGMSVVLAIRLAFTATWRPSFLTALSAAVALPGIFFLAPSVLPVVLSGCGLLITTTYLNHRRRNKEDSKIESQGAPVAPVVHFRKRLKQSWATIWSVTNLFRWSSWKAAAAKARVVGKRCLTFRPSAGQWMSGAVLVGAGVTMAFVYVGQNAENSELDISGYHARSTQHQGGDKGEAPAISYSSLSDSYGDLSYGAHVNFFFADGETVDATEHLGNAYIPNGWRATVKVTKLEGELKLHVEALDEVNDGSTTRQLSDSTPSVTFERTNCSGFPVPLLLSVTPYGDWQAGNAEASLRYEVEMEFISGCRL